MAAVRCGSCQKFASMDDADPEVQSLDVEATEGEGTNAHIWTEVRVVRNCADCGQELKEGVLSADMDIELKHTCGEKGVELKVEESSVETTTRVEGTGRGAKTFYGFKLEATVTCEECLATADVVLEDDIQASEMEVLE